MSQSTKIYISIGLILGLLLLLPKTRSILSSQNKQSGSGSQAESFSPNVSQNNADPANLNSSQQNRPSINSSTQITTSTSTSTVKDYLEVTKESSQKEKVEFEKTAMIKMNLPSDVIFSKQDSDEGMIAMVGRKQNSSQIYGVFARKGLTTNAEIEKFLPELAQRIPGVSAQLVNSKVTAVPYETSPDSSFKNVYTWQIQTDKNVFYMIKADRKDNFGSYMVFTTGNKKETERTEKDFEDIINSIQALPAAGN